MAVPVWLLALGKWAASILTRPAVQEAAREMAEAVIDEVVHADEKPQPLPYSAVEDQRRQIDSATSHKVAPCRKPPPGWSCPRGDGHTGPCAPTELAAQPDQGIGPGIVKARPRVVVVDRDKRTPRPKPPRPTGGNE